MGGKELPLPVLYGERVGVRGCLSIVELADSPPHPDCACAQSDLSPQAGRGEEGPASRIKHPDTHFANSFSPSRISCAVSAFSPALRETEAVAAAASAGPHPGVTTSGT